MVSVKERTYYFVVSRLLYCHLYRINDNTNICTSRTGIFSKTNNIKGAFALTKYEVMLILNRNKNSRFTLPPHLNDVSSGGNDILSFCFEKRQNDYSYFL